MGRYEPSPPSTKELHDLTDDAVLTHANMQNAKCTKYSVKFGFYVVKTLPWRGSHLTIWFAGSKHADVMSDTDKLSCEALLALKTGAYVTRGK